MNRMTPKQFFQQVLITEIGEIHLRYPYISFTAMSVGIEFLGKCLNEHDEWNYYAKGVPKQDFELAINTLNSFDKYRAFLTSHKLWDSLRNGFLHSFVPKGPVTLSSKDELANLVEHNGKINLRCEDLYTDFKGACEEVIAMTSFSNNKMYLPLLDLPDLANNASFNATTINTVGNP